MPSLPNLKVSTDPTTLLTHVDFSDQNSKVFNLISLQISSISEVLDYTTTGFILPFHDFKKSIVGIAKLLRKEGGQIEFDEFSQNLINNYVDDRKSRHQQPYYKILDSDLEKILRNSNFVRILTEEQMRDTKELLRLKHGANFSVPGAGKTTTLLAVHTILKSLGYVDSLFVVSPINAFISWEDEINVIFSIPKQVIRIQVDDLKKFSSIEEQNPDLILVNYEKLRKDVNRIYPFFINNQIHFVLDESHRIKSGYDNMSFRQIIQLADLAKRRDILSGTPMPQRFGDLSSQFDYLWSGDVIPDITYLSEESEKSKIVNKSLSGLFVRTTKHELGLKDPIIKYKYVQMGPIQSQLYKLFKSEAARILSNMDRGSLEFFRSAGRNVVRLLQAATNPMLLGTEDEYFEETFPIPPGSEAWELLSEFVKYEQASKIEYLINRVNQILIENQSNKIVIWSYFVRNIHLLERLLIEYNPVLIFGGIPSGSVEEEHTREWGLRKFHNDPSCRLLIANPQAGGEGISLHKICHYAIYLDRNFNAAHYLQSLDRIHRLGLSKSIDTIVEILIAKDSIDEVLINRLNIKTARMGKVLNDPYLLTLAYDPIDIPPESEFDLTHEDLIEIENHILS